MSMSEELYLVEKVMGKRKSLKQLGGVEYYVKWLGWGSENNTWEPAKHLETCPELVDQYEKELSHKEEKKTRKKWKKEVYTINVAHDKGSKSSVEDYNSNNLSVRMDNLDELKKDKSNTNSKGKMKINIAERKACWPSKVREKVPEDDENTDSISKKKIEFLEVSTESPFYVKDKALKEEICDTKSKRRGDCFEISPESPFCDQVNIKQEKTKSQIKIKEEKNIAEDVSVKQETKSDHAKKFFPVRIIGVTKEPPLPELHFYVEFRSREDSSSQTGLVPASEAYEDIPQMCLKFYEDRIVWNVKKESKE